MKYKFTGKTILQRLDYKDYELLSELTYENDKLRITALPGLITDGASIPKFLWSIIGCPFTGKYVGSAIFHDVLYASHVVNVKTLNSLFEEMLKDNNVGYIKRTVMCMGVKMYTRLNHELVPKEKRARASQFVNVIVKNSRASDVKV